MTRHCRPDDLSLQSNQGDGQPVVGDCETASGDQNGVSGEFRDIIKALEILQTLAEAEGTNPEIRTALLKLIATALGGDRPAPGQRKLGTVFRHKIRDKLIREAVERFFPNLSRSAQANALAKALADYESRTWRRESAEAVCPPRWHGRLPEYLWKILKAVPRPIKARMIGAILLTSSPYSLHANPVTFAKNSEGVTG